ncbi:glucose 1-dehydrogenase [Gordonia sp. HNM0687]|uniref:Glucose 1-dehydrogenase n=1 Tax=Gordonia mangrovi TaxID=2665643 RepID=A0A6L7GKF4_9ACTN|nr:glucose 1-dehydrogenase [Gordonia mangrovi]MXP20002.1 glucose 1-dehydrogenase [Gordonia mangrovi]UVF79382.1 glucose 1-dehydrogenase [Gordonia mangrovi]
MPGRLEGKVIIVTGAASGLGQASARRMTEEGADVLLADINEAQGHAIAEELGPRAAFRRCDVTSEDDVASLVDDAVTRHGRLDCMFNNAGVVGASGPIDELRLDEFEFVTAVLLRSVFLGMKHAARVMKPVGAGVILSTTSIAGVQGGWGPHLYAGAKAGVVGLTRNVAAELSTHGIRVVAIGPGKIVTPMTISRVVDDPDDPEQMAEAFRKRTPLRGHHGLPEDVANAAVWLASDEAAFVSGTTVMVDGGLTSGSKEGVTTDQLASWARRSS